MPKSLGRSRRGFSSSGASPWSDHLLNVVDLLIASIAVIAPLFMGGRGPMGKFVFAALVVAACAAWLGRQCLLAKSRWHWSGAEPLLAAGLVLVVVQL
ncbi:MAG: hypothetical protein QF805_22100, partial [Pirellulaceae bacterium]|nr:hypothetical protein [Pirellulaceae bacterium]